MASASRILSAALGALVIASCAHAPIGPTIQVMPAPSKPFEAFRADDAVCRDYANQQIAGGVEAANQRAVGSSVLGVALGAAFGAAASGGHGRSIGRGAAVGGAIGTAVGAGSSERSQYSVQQIYNVAYAQCMYSKGNQVPGYSFQRNLPPPPPPPPPRY